MSLIVTKQQVEHVVPGKRLGRHVHHDARSLRYPFMAPTITPASVRWSTDSDLILDQGNVGSCTGNAVVGALLCSLSPLHKALTPEQVASLGEGLAVKIYTRATQLDAIPGEYPSRDTGSDGLDAAKAAEEDGLIAGYTHTLSLQTFLQALTTGPVIGGIAWLGGFDNPDATGLIKPTGSVRGGHEICFDELDMERQLVWFRNSWTRQWGLDGRACMEFPTLNLLLQNRGDGTSLVPVTHAPPQPIPVPPQPEPTPQPEPAPVDPDKALVHAFRHWGRAKGLL